MKKNTKDTLENQVFVATVRLGDNVLKEMNELLKIWGMTVLQYNALSSIEETDTQGNGVASGEIKQHLYTRVPDVSRLLDRLEEKGWLSKARDPVNRRIVRVKLTETGLTLVKSAREPLINNQQKRFAHMSQKEMVLLLNLLNKAYPMS